MSDEQKAAPSSAGNPAVTWTIRIVVFGVLIGLLIVAYLQFSAKRAFEGSQDAVIAAFEESNNTFKIDDAKKLLTGDPERTEGKSDKIFKTDIFTWSGPFSEYKLRIKYAGTSGVVQRISGKDDEEE